MTPSQDFFWRQYQLASDTSRQPEDVTAFGFGEAMQDKFWQAEARREKYSYSLKDMAYFKRFQLVWPSR